MATQSSRRDQLDYQLQTCQAKLAIELALPEAKRPMVSSKFGPESAVFLHLITRYVPGIPVVNIQTGYETRATRAFIERLSSQLNLNLYTVQPKNHTITIPPSTDDPEHPAFTKAVKLEPFRRAMDDLEADVWLSSIRRYQSSHRSEEPVYRSLPCGVLKVSPLLDWSEGTVARYLEDNDLPIGPEAFDPTKGEAFRECGLHVAAGE